MAWTKFSNQAKAQYDLSLVNTRLQEIETVTADNKLNASTSASVKQLLDSHIADLNARVQNSSKNNQPGVGIEADAQLEASLNAHAKVLGLISAGKNSNAETRNNVGSILSDLKDKANEAKVELNDGNDTSGSSGQDELHDIINSNGGVNINIK